MKRPRPLTDEEASMVLGWMDWSGYCLCDSLIAVVGKLRAMWWLGGGSVGYDGCLCCYYVRGSVSRMAAEGVYR